MRQANEMEFSPEGYRQACWLSVYGAAMAIQMRDHMKAGRNIEPADADRFHGEAAAQADLSWDAMMRNGT